MLLWMEGENIEIWYKKQLIMEYKLPYESAASWVNHGIVSLVVLMCLHSWNMPYS